MNTSLTPQPGPDNPTTVDARFAGGTIFVRTEHVDWIGDTLVHVEMPGTNGTLMLRGFEARDLAKALQDAALAADGVTPREIHRPAEHAAAPETDGIGGGL